MRELKNWRTSKIYKTIIHEGKVLDTPAEGYYYKFSTISTKYGYVIAVEFNWKTNKLPVYFTQFSIIKDGMVITADINEANFSDRSLKWLTTHFVKQIFNL